METEVVQEEQQSERDLQSLGHGKRCWAEIDLAALERNLHHIRSNLPHGVRYVAVVKADAYGHGLYPTVSRLMQANVDLFAVATADEASRIQEIARGWPVLILGFVLPGEEAAIIRNGWIATVSSMDEIERFEASAAALRKKLQVHIKIDTGMGRLGVWHTETTQMYCKIQEMRHLDLKGIYTHYSDAANSPNFTRLQRQRFLDALESLPLENPHSLMIHSDNSAGVEAFNRDSPINAVRVGLLQFGVVQYPESIFGKIDIHSVLSLRTRVGLVKTVPPETPISYNRTFTTHQTTRIAVLTAGYGDGVPTSISNRGSVLISGQRCPILGQVTMDQMIVDVSALDSVSAGDLATLIGQSGKEEIDVREFSHWAGSIPWEIFCNVSKRVPRIYFTTRR